MKMSFYYGTEAYNGKPCLSDETSFKYKESQSHWKREIKDAYENGKAIIVFLSDLDEIYVATGKRDYSGTGRNQRTTRHVGLASNYGFIPIEMEVVSSIGNKIITNPRFQYLKEFMSGYSEELSFKVTIASKSIEPLLFTKTGNKIVGGIVQNKASGGYILLLPPLDFEKEGFTEELEEDEVWSAKGKSFGSRFIASLIGIHKAIRSGTERTPHPDWLSTDAYLLKKEIEIRSSMAARESQVANLVAEISKAKEELVEVTSLKDLLYEQGKPLEYAILKALQLIGFKTTQFKENDSEFDVVFECDEGRLLGEAEGKDNKAINVDKLRQLEMNINEDFT
jgi:hypothetical protein